MIRRNTWILLVVLVALIGFAIYFNKQKAQQATQATPTSGPVSLFSSNLGEPNDIKIEDTTGQSVEITRDSSGTWTLKAPTQDAADQGSAEAAATQVTALRVLGDVKLGPDVLGLDKPSYTVTLTFKNGETHTLTIGSATPIQTGYYVQIDGGNSQIADKQGIDALLGLLSNPPYAATATPAETATSTPEPATATPETTLTPADVMPQETETATASP